MNNKLTALSLCLLMLLANILCFAKTLEVLNLNENSAGLIIAGEIFLAITLLFSIAYLGANIFENRSALYRRFLPFLAAKIDRSKSRSGFLKRRFSWKRA